MSLDNWWFRFSRILIYFLVLSWVLAAWFTPGLLARMPPHPTRRPAGNPPEGNHQPMIWCRLYEDLCTALLGRVPTGAKLPMLGLYAKLQSFHMIVLSFRNTFNFRWAKLQCDFLLCTRKSILAVENNKIGKRRHVMVTRCQGTPPLWAQSLTKMIHLKPWALTASRTCQ